MSNDLEIFDCEQGTAEWFEAKLGVPSASMFHAVLAGGNGLVRGKYLRQLAGEIVTGLPREDYSNRAMQRGIEMEPHLRSLYEMMTDADVVRIGFAKRKMVRGFAGCSPDGCIGDAGGVQFKSVAPDGLIEIMKDGRVPSEHLPQLQGEMMVMGWEWIDIAIGYTGMPLFRRRVRRDSSYQARLALALQVFNEELEEMVEWVRRYGKEGA